MSNPKSPYIRVAGDGRGVGNSIVGHNSTLDYYENHQGFDAGEAIYKLVGEFKNVTAPGETQPIKVGDVLQDKNGRTVRVVATDAAGKQPVVGLVAVDGRETPCTYCANGQFLWWGQSANDLVLKTTPARTERRFVPAS